MNFASDNVAGAAPEILDAVVRAAAGAAGSYGDDEITQRVERRLAELFEREVAVFLVATGSAANSLALSVMTPPYGVIYSHAEAHIQTDECSAPEFFTGGAKLRAVPGQDGKISAADLDAVVAAGGKGVVHFPQPAAVSVTQATEAGTVYTADELGALGEVCRRHGLGFHVDGARFANALAGRGESAAADMTWRAGVDALSLGGTKNGCLGVEAVVFFDPAKAGDFGFRRKRGGHLFSKMRFLSAQMDAYLDGGLWLRLAAHANAMARRLADGLAALPGVSLAYAVEANEIFADLPGPMIDGLLAAGAQFHRWGPETATRVRLVASFATTEAEVDGFVALARRLSNGAPVA